MLEGKCRESATVYLCISNQQIYSHKHEEKVSRSILSWIHTGIETKGPPISGVPGSMPMAGKPIWAPTSIPYTNLIQVPRLACRELARYSEQCMLSRHKIQCQKCVAAPSYSYEGVYVYVFQIIQDGD